MNLKSLKTLLVLALFGLMACQNSTEKTEDTSAEDQLEAEQLEDEMQALEAEMAGDTTMSDSSEMSHP